MPDEFLDLPAHPLLVHAAVVFVPLLAVLVIAYAVVPPVRPRIRWAVVLLAFGTPVSALLAKVSGDAFFDRLDAEGEISAEYYPKLESHQDLGSLTVYATIALALLSLALAYFVDPGPAATRTAGRARSNRVLALALGALSLLAAAVSLYYVVRTGDSGARAVWGDS